MGDVEGGDLVAHTPRRTIGQAIQNRQHETLALLADKNYTHTSTVPSGIEQVRAGGVPHANRELKAALLLTTVRKVSQEENLLL